MPWFIWTLIKHRLSLLYWPDLLQQGVVVVLQVALPSRLFSPATTRSPLSSDLAGSLATCLLLPGSCRAACAWQLPVPSAKACEGYACHRPPGCLPSLARAQWHTMRQRDAIRSCFPQPPLPKLAQTLLLLQPVPKASDNPVPAAAAALVPANTGGCWVLLCGSPGLFLCWEWWKPRPPTTAASPFCFLPQEVPCTPNV